MKQSGFVIAITVLMLSACGNKSEKESTVVPVSPPLAEHNTTVITDPSMASPTKDKVSETALPESALATPTTPDKTGSKLPKTNESIKGELSSRKKVLSVEQSAPIIAGQPMLSPTVEKALEKAVLESAAPKPSSPTKTEMPLTVNKGTGGGSLNREEGLALANKSGCLVCHKIETKLIGPAWRDVSKRYNGDTDAKARLIAKVKVGGKGNWTDVTGGIAMPPYSPRVSDENIEKLVTFVLSQ
ncbi:c-type cytochrome [Candidatus Nitrotoga arctica]|uniref:Cytochrome c domain-containing protein n=1 Tax=Candidatus Nitrotoga arctica TaxID=453162 RepID=A0ABM8YXN4_9PROT|nr:c-type cytochrome [Candidatus Nitrotoga arctica]CAG9932288.1 Cytochrome c domain-containing protein [Candidatus Nitrotoga arctica]